MSSKTPTGGDAGRAAGPPFHQAPPHPDPVLWVREDAQLAFVNEAACRSLGYGPDELLSMSLFELDPCFQPEGWSRVWSLLQAEGPVTFETRHQVKAGWLLPVEITADHWSWKGEDFVRIYLRDVRRRKEAERELRRAHGELEGQMRAVVEELVRVRVALGDERQRREGLESSLRSAEEKYRLVTAELEAANSVLQRASSIDGLTAVANRRRFEEVLETEWRRAARGSEPLSLLMADLDFFKQYNDHYGHVQGDECLKRCAASFLATVRRPADFVARYGGEEFAVVLPETDGPGARAVAERLRAGVESLAIPHAVSPIGERVTVSVGVASIVPGPDTEPTPLIVASDRALYEAKSAGRNRVAVAP